MIPGTSLPAGAKLTGFSVVVNGARQCKTHGASRQVLLAVFNVSLVASG